MEEKDTSVTQGSTEIKLSGFNKFLCGVAGSDRRILQDPKCAHEISRHARIGAVIISTAVLATCSMFFAIHTISQSFFTAIVFGLVWGMVILVLDSYIISSYRKQDNKWKEFRLITPRLILALILGCSISIPLELRFFATEIADETVTMKTEKQTENQQKANIEYESKISPLLQEKEKLENSNRTLRKELDTVYSEIDDLNTKMSKEQIGEGITHEKGKGPSYRNLEAQKNDISENKLPQLRATNDPQIKQNSLRIIQLDSQVATIQKPIADSVKFTGLSTQMTALSRLTGKNNYVKIAYWIFFLLILVIETAPIFTKFFSQKSSYDVMLEMNEYEAELLQQKRKSDLHELINAELLAIRSINTQRSIAQDSINEKLMKSIAEAQGEIGEKAIQLWKLQHFQKIDQNVEDYVQSTL